MKNKLCLFFFISQALHTAPLSPKPISLEDLEKFIKCRIILELMNRNSISPETLEILQEEKEKLNCAGLEHEKFVAYLKLENEVSMLKKELEQDLYILYKRLNLSYSDLIALRKKAFASVTELMKPKGKI